MNSFKFFNKIGNLMTIKVTLMSLKTTIIVFYRKCINISSNIYYYLRWNFKKIGCFNIADIFIILATKMAYQNRLSYL